MIRKKKERSINVIFREDASGDIRVQDRIMAYHERAGGVSGRVSSHLYA